MGNKKIRIISRQSRLALLQVEELISLLPKGLEYEVIKTESYGDRHKDVSLMDPSVAADFFTRELDEALREGRADIAVHSAKDLPYPLPSQIKLIALTEGLDKSDSLVARDGLTLATLPPGSKVGTSSVQRKAELLAVRPDLEVVPIRGTIEERIAQVKTSPDPSQGGENKNVDALIVATCALVRLGLADKATEQLPFKTHPLQGNLAVTASVDASKEIKELLSAIDIRKSYGKVTLVGFGPGDPELLTIKGYKALEQADVIFYDDLTNEEFLKQFKAEKVYVGKRSGKHSHNQDEINELLYQAAASPPALPRREGAAAQNNRRSIVRLKGGDPMVFAHGREEIDYLKSRFVEVEVIPGISSGNALASLLQIPLTHRGVARSVAFVLGHSNEPQTPNADTLLYYMGGAKVSEIAHQLLKAGRPPETPVALVTNVSLPQQHATYSTLGELKWAVFKETPVLIVVGDVVRFAAHNNKVYDTGSASPTPLITISPTDTPQPKAEDFDYVVFTSRYGVRYYTQPLDKVKVISVGPVTSEELRKKGIEPYYESPTQSAEGILEYFRPTPNPSRQREGSRILLPRSDKGLKALSEGLVALGHEVVDLAVYTNRPNANAVKQDLTQYDKIVFSSPSGVEAFKALYGEGAYKGLIIAKGKTTYEAIQTI